MPAQGGVAFQRCLGAQRLTAVILAIHPGQIGRKLPLVAQPEAGGQLGAPGFCFGDVAILAQEDTVIEAKTGLAPVDEVVVAVVENGRFDAPVVALAIHSPLQTVAGLLLEVGVGNDLERRHGKVVGNVAVNLIVSGGAEAVGIAEPAAPCLVEAVTGRHTGGDVVAVVLGQIAVRCAQALAVKAQGRGKLPVAQIDHIAQPDAIAAGFGLAEGGFLSLGGDAIFQGQIADWPLVVGLLQLHTVAEGVIQRAGAQLALQLQLAAKAQLLERGEGALAAISGIAAQGIVAQQLALVGFVA